MAQSICIFGDSVGKGIIFDSVKQKYVMSHTSFFDILAQRIGVAADNFCRFGCTLSKGAELIDKKMATLSKYDYVLLEFGGNDSDFHWDEVAAAPDKAHECNTPINTFISLYERVIQHLRNNGAKPVLVNLSPVDSERYYNWISRSNDGSAILQFLREPRRIEHWNEMYNNAVWDIAGRHSVPVLDIRSPILYERNFTDYFCEDGIHPNDAGQRLIADRLYTTLSFKET